MAISQSLMERLGKVITSRREFSKSPYDEKKIDLTGKRAIVQRGQYAIIRLLPGPLEDPENIYAEAKQHWVPSPRTTFDVPVYCLKSQDESADCPVCDAVAKMQKSPDEQVRQRARESRARDVFFWGVCVGSLKSRTQNPQCGFIVLSDFLSQRIASIMTGEGEEEFAYGNISDPKEGYDLKFTRPAAEGDRWLIEVAQKPTPLFVGVNKPRKAWPQAWKTWEKDFILPLEEVVKSYVEASESDIEEHARYLLSVAGSGGIPEPADEEEEVFEQQASQDEDEVELVEEEEDLDSSENEEDGLDLEDDDLPF